MKSIEQLAKIIVKINDKKTAKEFLSNLLTPKELEEIPKRIEIIKLLKKGLPQREIAENLGVGIATVTRGAKELKYGAPGFEKLI